VGPWRGQCPLDLLCAKRRPMIVGLAVRKSRPASEGLAVRRSRPASEGLAVRDYRPANEGLLCVTNLGGSVAVVQWPACSYLARASADSCAGGALRPAGAHARGGRSARWRARDRH